MQEMTWKASDYWSLMRWLLLKKHTKIQCFSNSFYLYLCSELKKNCSYFLKAKYQQGKVNESLAILGGLFRFVSNKKSLRIRILEVPIFNQSQSSRSITSQVVVTVTLFEHRVAPEVFRLKDGIIWGLHWRCYYLNQK